jgi:hypothetical protein
MRRIEEIRSAILLEYARWGDNYRAETYTRDDWLAELDWVLAQYLPRRSEVLLEQLRRTRLYPTLDAPTFSQHGGEVRPGFLLRMSVPSDAEAAIYFTTDGSDPRVAVSGALSERANLYTRPLALNEDTLMRARALTIADEGDSSWSALNEARFTVRGEPLPEGRLLPGDFNRDRRLNLLDPLLLLQRLFGDSTMPLPCGGGALATGPNQVLLDADGSGRVDLTDIVYALNALFQRGPHHVLGTECVELSGCTENPGCTF